MVDWEPSMCRSVFFHQEGFICDLNNQDSFIFSPLFSGFLPDSVLLLSGGCSKKAGSSSPIFKKRKEMAIIFVLFQDKKWNELSSMVFQTKLHSIKLFQVSKTAWSPAWGLTSRPAALNELFSMSEKKKVRSYIM